MHIKEEKFIKIKELIKGKDENKMENKNLEKEIEQIKQRNQRVELDKKWETSGTRKVCICILTYIVVVIYSYLTNKMNNIFLSSLVPVIGFTLSTISLKFIRKIWERQGGENDV